MNKKKSNEFSNNKFKYLLIFKNQLIHEIVSQNK
jgi:hypothetical protein